MAKKEILKNSKKSVKVLFLKTANRLWLDGTDNEVLRHIWGNLCIRVLDLMY